MILGIDFGASTVDAVLLDGKKVVKKASSHKSFHSGATLNQFLKSQKFNGFPIEKIAITGGKSLFFKGRVLGFKPTHVEEVKAIGLGAGFLSKSKKCLAVSMGTGTCIVLFEKGKAKHVIGTGVGGGTVLGLSRLLVWEEGIARLAKIAQKGNSGKVDLSVKEVVGKGFGLLNGNATASNFAKGSGSRADVAAAIQNMVAESVAILAISAARENKCRKIVFLGKVPEFPFVKKRLGLTARCFKTVFDFPKNYGVGTAIGAALALQEH